MNTTQKQRTTFIMLYRSILLFETIDEIKRLIISSIKATTKADTDDVITNIIRSTINTRMQSAILFLIRLLLMNKFCSVRSKALCSYRISNNPPRRYSYTLGY